MKITHRPVAPIGARRDNPQYDFIDEETEKTVLHLEIHDEEYLAEWPTYATQEQFVDFLRESDPMGRAEISVAYPNPQRERQDEWTSDLETIEQELHDWDSCNSISADLAAIEVSWREDEDDQYTVSLHSHNGKFRPLGETYKRLPYRDYREVAEDHEEFVHTVLPSVRTLLEDKLTISI